MFYYIIYPSGWLAFWRKLDISSLKLMNINEVVLTNQVYEHCYMWRSKQPMCIPEGSLYPDVPVLTQGVQLRSLHWKWLFSRDHIVSSFKLASGRKILLTSDSYDSYFTDNWPNWERCSNSVARNSGVHLPSDIKIILEWYMFSVGRNQGIAIIASRNI